MVREDMQIVAAKEEDTENRERLRTMTLHGNSKKNLGEAKGRRSNLTCLKQYYNRVMSPCELSSPSETFLQSKLV